MAPVDGLVVGIVSLLVGALAIHIAASLMLRGQRSYFNAIVVAAAGSLVYSVLGLLGGIPLLGPLLLL